MREEARLWIKDALYDLECAADMLERGRCNYAVWLSRQAVEKLLKACYPALLRMPVPREHNLLTLGAECFGPEFDEIRPHAAFLNPHYTTARYVDAAVGAPADVYDREFAQQAYARAQEAVAWIRARLN